MKKSNRKLVIAFLGLVALTFLLANHWYTIVRFFISYSFIKIKYEIQAAQYLKTILFWVNTFLIIFFLTKVFELKGNWGLKLLYVVLGTVWGWYLFINLISFGLVS